MFAPPAVCQAHLMWKLEGFFDRGRDVVFDLFLRLFLSLFLFKVFFKGFFHGFAVVAFQVEFWWVYGSG